MKSKLYSILRWCDRYGALAVAILWLFVAISSVSLAITTGKTDYYLSHATYESLLAMSWFIIDSVNRKQ